MGNGHLDILLDRNGTYTEELVPNLNCKEYIIHVPRHLVICIHIQLFYRNTQ